LGEDENQHPERMEHFGITTAEAMSAGCVPVVINKGGQTEIVRHGVDGFLWNTVQELKEYTVRLINDNALQGKMGEESVARSQDFSMEKFEQRVKQVFLEV
jgi:glycosyltransferase involved in cell wall biosynthesis